jgi:hypothetical protein
MVKASSEFGHGQRSLWKSTVKVLSAGRQEDFVIAARPTGPSPPGAFLGALTAAFTWVLSFLLVATPVLADCGDSIDGESVFRATAATSWSRYTVATR